MPTDSFSKKMGFVYRSRLSSQPPVRRKLGKAEAPNGPKQLATKVEPGLAAARKGRALLPGSVQESRRTDPDAAAGNGRLEIIADMPDGKRVSASQFRSTEPAAVPTAQSGSARAGRTKPARARGEQRWRAARRVKSAAKKLLLWQTLRDRERAGSPKG